MMTGLADAIGGEFGILVFAAVLACAFIFAYAAGARLFASGSSFERAFVLVGIVAPIAYGLIPFVLAFVL